MKRVLCCFFCSCALATPPDFTAFGLSQAQKEEMQEKYQEFSRSKRWQGAACKVEFDKEEYEIKFYMDALQDYNSTTEGIIASLDYAYKEYEKLLDKYYLIAKNSLPTHLKDALNNDQIEWLNFQAAQEAYLDKHYAFLSALNGGEAELSIDKKRASLAFLTKRVVELFEGYYCQP
ncbi:lysozyme inhibitor LprI family protein [Campylobacter sp.]|uniref:lysozyme inhibitor LprI family protein n=1 Tax=Campylobacter sp. TaxID=205 RepID=UPI0026DC6B3D|nr:lysozyme inhibitor LprI family protein [Campylobacter sp.]MDO4674628.1 hypothetical protein [Campylobacter sp.]